MSTVELNEGECPICEGMRCEPTAERLAAMLYEYVESHGWTRTHQGSGWWYPALTFIEKFGVTSDETIGEAVELCLMADGVDLRIGL